MPPRRKSALEDLIRQGLVADGELLRYKSKQGQVMAIGRAREGGIEVEGKSKLLGYTAFEDVAGSKYHRPAEHTHTTASRNLQGLALLAAGEGGGSAGGRSRKDADEEPAVELLEDENDDLCHVCGLGGDLMCCETCPAVFHAACLGLAAPPAGDFFCPMCICSVCGNGRSEGVMPTGCQWVDCQNFAGTEALQQLSRPHIGPPGDTGSQGPGSTAHAGAAPPAADAAAVKVESTEVLEAAGSAGAAGAEPMQVDAAGEAGAPADVAAGASAEGAAGYPAADFSQLVAAASAQWQATHAPADAAQASVARQAIAASASENAAVPCPVTLRWAHLRCFPPEFIQQLRQGTSQPCISSAEAAATSTRLAVVCSAGLLPLGSIPEGTRAESGGAAGVDARAPLPLSLLVVRGAAAAAPGDCRGYAPAYSAEQRQQVQVALSAALQLLHSCYAPIPDSRTGADILPWLLRGAVLANGEADFSGMHTALLYAGSALVAVAAFRSFGEFAELPVLAVRPELQRRNALGRLLLAAVEQLLLQAGSQTLGLHWRRGRYLDFYLFLTGFLLAIVYHVLHMHPEGIAKAEFLGLSGATWRGLDILMAQALLARTCGHALGARLAPTRLLCNLVFPASLLVYAHLFADGVLTLGVASRVLVLVLLCTLACKGLLEGWSSVPAYCPRLGKRTLACFALGFAAFPMPELFPRQYWLYHSIWHVLMAEAFHLLYYQLEGLHLQQGAGRRGRRRALAPAAFFPVGAELFSEDEEEHVALVAELQEVEEEEGAAAMDATETDDEDALDEEGMEADSGSEGSDSEAESEAAAAAAAAAAAGALPRAGGPARGGLLHALLQPAARLVRYQRQQERLERRLASRKDL
ncbi:hypothetical protein ABPG77_002085 [Micractinium sp. CCAP 211/92]